MYAEANKLDAAGGKGGANLPGKADRAGPGLGLYRAGGPTTIFGGSGWGPYSDGPLNAVRKSLLNRDGLNEENWMHIAAQRTAEAAEAFSKIRKEALQVCGGVQDRGGLPIDDDLKKREAEDSGDGGRRKKVRSIEDVLPLGLYEAHSGIVHCKLFSVLFFLFKKSIILVVDRGDTQPTTSRWEVMPNSLERRVLGGTKSGNGAWALAWVDTVLEVPSTEEMEKQSAQDRVILMSSVASQS
jgi:chromatin structure-remodeling complex protein RSC7